MYAAYHSVAGEGGQRRVLLGIFNTPIPSVIFVDGFTGKPIDRQEIVFLRFMPPPDGADVDYALKRLKSTSEGLEETAKRVLPAWHSWAIAAKWISDLAHFFSKF